MGIETKVSIIFMDGLEHKTTNSSQEGIAYLIGAGPGHPGLITVRGKRLLEQADVVLYDRLIPRIIVTS